MRISHVSDLHFGHHDERLADTLAAELATQTPDLVVVSGDFTMIGSRAEFARARAFLDSLTGAVVCRSRQPRRAQEPCPALS